MSLFWSLSNRILKIQTKVIFCRQNIYSLPIFRFTAEKENMAEDVYMLSEKDYYKIC